VTRAESPVIGSATDFRNIQGGSAIPWNTVTITSCDRRVNRVEDEEGEGSHPARRATQQRGCQPQRIVLGRPNEITASLTWSLVTGERASLPEGIPDARETRGEEEEEEKWWAVWCQQRGCSSTVQADPTRGKREREGSPVTKKYEHGGRRQGHDFSNADRTDRATQEKVQYQRAGPPWQLLHR